MQLQTHISSLSHPYLVIITIILITRYIPPNTKLITPLPPPHYYYHYCTLISCPHAPCHPYRYPNAIAPPPPLPHLTALQARSEHLSAGVLKSLIALIRHLITMPLPPVPLIRQIFDFVIFNPTLWVKASFEVGSGVKPRVEITVLILNSFAHQRWQKIRFYFI